MTDPKIVTDADTVIRLAKKAKGIAAILDDEGSDNIVLIEPVGGRQPMVACIAERNDRDGSWIAVAIEGGDVWHYDPDTDVGTPAPAPAAVPVPVPVRAHPGDNDGFTGDRHFTAEMSCFCLDACCNSVTEACICRWGCVDPGHVHG